MVEVHSDQRGLFCVVDPGWTTVIEGLPVEAAFFSARSVLVPGVVDGVEAGLLVGEPECGAECAGGEDVSRECVVFEDDFFERAGESHGMVSDDATGSECVDAVGWECVFALLVDGFGECFGGSGGRVFLVGVVDVDEVDLEVASQECCGLFDECFEDGDAE